MEALYLLIPFSALLVLAILAIFAWALRGGQFDDLEREGGRILEVPLDAHQPATDAAPQQSSSLHRGGG
ncbi:MAG: cbb3-type cytochrome oxidase assembly protein CcoS [Burkholderiaceae bacterium]|nr:cbb3-type cytochrome oxidase assembly protein CcoS [Burkholderiaceae bacterium]